MLNEAKIIECLKAAGCIDVVRMSFESGPYFIDRPTIKADNFARAIESAACKERDARIAELERELEEARKDAERLDGLDDLLQGGTLTIRMVHFLSAASRVQISHVGEDPIGDSFDLRAAIDAAIKEQTK